MPERRAREKRGLFLFTLGHAYASSFFLYGAPFYAQRRWGWNAGQIALMEALSGLFIAGGSYAGGQIAQRATSRRAILTGLLGSLLATLAGLIGTGHGGAWGLIPAMALFSGFQAVVWPGLESALVADETSARIQHIVGGFNLTWSLGTATAVLTATPLMTGWDTRVFYILPIVLFALGLLFNRPLIPVPASPRVTDIPPLPSSPDAQGTGSVAAAFSPRGEETGAAGLSERATFRAMTEEQRMAYRWLAWLANPLAYVAINVINTNNPTVGTRLGLAFGAASVGCSLWFYARAVAFELLRRWVWWHYRWRFLCLTFGVAILSFAAMEWATTLAVFLGAQIVFGLAVGLIYQSSLFYSMAESETQGTHGGFHETFIGLGQMFGPLIFYFGTRLRAGTQLFPVACVLALMTTGLIALIAIGRHADRR